MLVMLSLLVLGSLRAAPFRPLECPAMIEPTRPLPQPRCPGGLADVVAALGGAAVLLRQVETAAAWLTNTSQIQSRELPADVDPKLGPSQMYATWRGAYRSEYQCGRGSFDMCQSPK